MEEWTLDSASKEHLEVLEWFGDAILEELTQRILILKSTRMGVSLSPRLFNVLRDAFLTNTNLSYVYDRQFKKEKGYMSIKRRADRVEAYFGYLYVRFDSETSKKQKTIARKKMDGLLSNIMNICDLSLAAEDSSRVSRSTNQFEILNDFDGTVTLEEEEHDDVGQILREKEWETIELEKDESSRLLENLLFLLEKKDEEEEEDEEKPNEEDLDSSSDVEKTEISGNETTNSKTATPHLSVLTRYGRKLLSEKMSRYLFFKNLNKKTCPDTLTRTRQDILSTKRVAELSVRLISSTAETERDKAAALFRAVAQQHLRNESELLERVTRELLQRDVNLKSHFQNINNMFPRSLLCCSRVLQCYCSEWSMKSSPTDETHRIGISLAPLEIVVPSSSSSDRKRPRKQRRRRRRGRKKKRIKIEDVCEKEDSIGVTSCLANFNRCTYRGEILRLATSTAFRTLEILILLLSSLHGSSSYKTMQDVATRALNDIETKRITLSQVLNRLSHISVCGSCNDWIEFRLRDPMELRMLKVLCSAHGARVVLKSDETIRVMLTRRDGTRKICIGATSIIRFVVEAII